MNNKTYEILNEPLDNGDYQSDNYSIRSQKEQEEYSKKITKLALLERKLNALKEGEWGSEDEEPPNIYLDIVG